MNAWYIRKSLDGQDYERQVKDLKAYCLANSINVPSQYRFEETGKRDDVEFRPIFNETIMGLVRTKKIQTLLVVAYDRLGFKNDMEFNAYAWEFVKNGCQIVSVTEGSLTDLQDETGGIKRWMKSNQSRGETLSRSSRVLSWRLSKATSGEKLSGVAPLGFDTGYYSDAGLEYRLHFYGMEGNRAYTRTLPDGTKRKDTVGSVVLGKIEYDAAGNLVRDWGREKRPKSKAFRPFLMPSIDPQDVACVQFLFQTFATQRISLHKLAKLANKSYSNRGRNFTHRTLQEIFKREQYLGTMVDCRSTQSKFHSRKAGKVTALPVRTSGPKVTITQNAAEDVFCVPDAHTALIDKATWDKVQAKLQGMTKTDRVPVNPVYWLKGLLWCGHCGGIMTPTKRGGKPCYTCSAHKKSVEYGKPSPCGSNTVRHDEVAALVADKVKELGQQLAEANDIQAVAKIKQRLQDNRGELANLFAQSARDWLGSQVAILETYREHVDAVLWGETSASLQATLKKISAMPTVAGYVWQAVLTADADLVKLHQARLAKLTADHERLTLKWVDASDLAQGTIRKRMDAVEAEIAEVKPRTESLGEKAGKLTSEKENLLAALADLERTLAASDLAAKAESVRGVFERIVVTCRKVPNAATNNVRWVLPADGIRFYTKPDGDYGFQ